MSGQNASQLDSNASLSFAQLDDSGFSMDNSTMMNATLSTSIISMQHYHMPNKMIQN